jgi:hypothetical protein
MPRPSTIELWLPRADEHALAASLGMCERDPELQRRLVEAGREEAARLWPGSPVRVRRYHVWRVVRAMHRGGFLNTPDGRAGAVALLADAAADGEDQP